MSLQKVLRSSLFGSHEVRRIPVPFDESVFRPANKEVARDLLQLPVDKRIVLFGATMLDDSRKGMQHLVEALKRLRASLDKRGAHADDVFLAYLGLKPQALVKALSFDGKWLGYLQDSVTLALAYRAADVFVCASVDDEGPAMIPESMLCGTPVVSFPTGYAVEYVESSVTGYLCENRNSDDLAHGLQEVLFSPRRDEMGVAARERALREHSRAAFVGNFTSVCLELLGKGHGEVSV